MAFTLNESIPVCEVYLFVYCSSYAVHHCIHRAHHGADLVAGKLCTCIILVHSHCCWIWISYMIYCFSGYENCYCYHCFRDFDYISCPIQFLFCSIAVDIQLILHRTYLFQRIIYHSRSINKNLNFISISVFVGSIVHSVTLSVLVLFLSENRKLSHQLNKST